MGVKEPFVTLIEALQVFLYKAAYVFQGRLFPEGLPVFHAEFKERLRAA
jgi:hypothetical protein